VATLSECCAESPSRRRSDRRTVAGIIRMLMDINAKLDRLLDEEEDEDASEDGP
jgi:hypothetical protein